MKHILIGFVIFFIGCGGGGSGNSGDDSSNNDNDTTSQEWVWEKAKITEIDGGGMLTPNIIASKGNAHDVHIVYFEDDTANGYAINHLIVDDSAFTVSAEDKILSVDNCRTLGVSGAASGTPVVAYQGGEIRECGSEQQSDAMISIWSGNAWTEYTAGIGYVERNPVFQDGLAGKTVATAMDSKGDIHVCYQFFYEGCDAMNFNFPDLLYVKKDGANLSAASAEEVVTGNVYNPNGTASEQNRIGDRVAIMVDENDAPVIFYDADLSPVMPDPDEKGLRVSRKTGDRFEHAWIETGIKVAYLSCAMDKDGNPAVAYYIEDEYEDTTGTHEKCLKFAILKNDQWTVQMVDESVLCGNYCSLSFDQNGNPWIAYYAEGNHSGSISMKDLKVAYDDGTAWKKEVVSETGDIGSFNTLWFDTDNMARICSYEKVGKAIYMFVQREGGQ